MKAMILAAGRGERMLPLTQDKPKPLLMLGDKTLIEYHLIKLAQAGFREVVINISYLADMLRDYLGSGENYGLKIEYSREVEPLETAGALKQAQELLGDKPFLLINADAYTDLSFDDVGAHQLEGDILAHLVLVANPAHNISGDYSLSDEGKLQKKETISGNTKIIGRSQSYTFSGISLIHPELIRLFPFEKSTLPLRDVFSWAIDNARISGQVYTGEWWDVGTPERLLQLEEKLGVN